MAADVTLSQTIKRRSCAAGWNRLHVAHMRFKGYDLNKPTPWLWYISIYKLTLSVWNKTKRYLKNGRKGWCFTWFSILRLSLTFDLSDCDDKHWGANCKQQCKCENGALCDPVKGTCRCPPGFNGRYCEESCPAGTFGKRCLQRCKCATGGSCDKATGECICRDGFTGT